MPLNSSTSDPRTVSGTNCPDAFLAAVHVPMRTAVMKMARSEFVHLLVTLIPGRNAEGLMVSIFLRISCSCSDAGGILLANQLYGLRAHWNRKVTYLMLPVERRPYIVREGVDDRRMFEERRGVEVSKPSGVDI